MMLPKKKEARGCRKDSWEQGGDDRCQAACAEPSGNTASNLVRNCIVMHVNPDQYQRTLEIEAQEKADLERLFDLGLGNREANVSR